MAKRLTVVKFVLPDQRLQSPKLRCNFPLCNLKFVSFTKFWIMSLRAWGVVRGAKALTVNLLVHITMTKSVC